MDKFSEKPLILVVDDTPENIEVLANVLRDNFEVKAALNGARALKIANTQPRPDMILLDIMMPQMDGYEVCQTLKADPATSDIPIIFVTAKDDVSDEEHGFELGAVDYITKPISPSIVLARVHTQLALYDQSRQLARRIEERTRELHDTRLKIIQRLGRAAEYRDNETGYHVIRMSHYTRLIAREYGGNPSWVEMLFNAAPMHDVGKIGVPDNILLKPGKLDAEEWETMKKHTEFGAEIIGEEDSPLLRMSSMIAMTHHEKWDGSGYPKGLAGEDIPLEGRIVAIADVFDALTSERPYKKAWTVEDAVSFIEENAGKHFDPALVAMFHKVLPEILDIKKNYVDHF
jgi:putative two-component system response regulator